MGQIRVSGLGVVNIQGDTPTPEEQNAIIQALGQSQAPAIPQPIVPEQLQRGEPAPEIRGMEDIASRSTFEAAGGMIGAFGGAAAAGAAAAPTVAGIPPAVIAGTIAGGGLGAAAGSAVFDNLDNLGKVLGIFEGEPEGGMAVGERALEAGATDVAFGTAGFAAGPLFNVLRGGKPIIARILGIADDEARALAQQSARTGIDLGIGDISPRASVKGFPRVLGVIPLVGRPGIKAAVRKGEEVVTEANKLVNDLAPLGHLSDLGIDITKAAEANFSVTREKIGKVWKLFEKAVAKAGKQDIIPSTATKDFLTEELEAAAEGAIRQELPTISLNKPLNDYLLGLQEALPERITLKQFRGIQKKLSQFADDAAGRKSGEDLRTIGTMRRNLQTDLQDIITDGLEEGVAEGIKSSLDLANKFTTTELARFETATASKLGRLVDKNMFKPGAFKAGTKTAEELGLVFQNLPSKQAVNEFRDVVGDELVQKLAQQKASNAFDKALRPMGGTNHRIFDPIAFEKNLGLDKPLIREAFEEAIKNSPVNIKEFDDFIGIAKKAYGAEIGDPSSFVARRLALALGTGGLAGGALAAGLGGISTAAIALGVLGNRASKFLSNPKSLKAMTRLLDSTLPDAQRRGAALRAFGAIIEENQQIQQTQTGA